jgi:hypothetical protein
MPDLVEDTARDTAKVLAEDTVWDLIMDRMVATAPDTVAATVPAGNKLKRSFEGQPLTLDILDVQCQGLTPTFFISYPLILQE